MPNIVGWSPGRTGASKTLSSLFVVLVVAGGIVALGACQAPFEDKKGGIGEFCNGVDDQCRTGLVCQEGVCTSLNNAPSVCETVCAKFDECDATVSGCQRACLQTLRKWSPETTETYENCYEEVSCIDIQEREKRPWNVCYEELDLRDSRRQRCDQLEGASETCLSEFSEDYSDEIDSFQTACRRKGRTESEERWSETDECVEFAEQSPIQCGKMFRCINDSFSLSEGNRFPTERPE